MGWKKDFKKFKKEQFKKSSIFDYSHGESSIIEWQRSFESVDFYNVDNLLTIIQEFNKEIKEQESLQQYPEVLENGYDWLLNEINTKEHFESYPCHSYFKNVYEQIAMQNGHFAACLLTTALTKFTYYTTLKFWKVFNFTFANKNINDPNLGRLFEVMQRTGLDAVEGIINKALLLMDDKEIIPYKQHLLVEEIIDLGDEFTYHWSRMLDQAIDLTIEAFNFEAEYGSTNTYSYTNTSNFNSNQEDFEDFFEKTKTMVFNDEVNEAFNYFGISKLEKPEIFKKVYRKLAKQYHPDVNPDPGAANEMKKINVFKTIVEQYYEKYDLI
ncbi:DnaJ domain-containing protein [Spiroplasma culicicola]|uniref:J domain-containing protein n=1 Tax=Spiroplasma culicicola AES-1 TaxID=1276246 RepID=W6A6R9_9MOLU|nr:DnaJ domain-containing protein [Spiroplasma culicicola]AHI52565.1 hypothetical protein SCULI_v1c02240 [Spiroplasma culicicola AES-1]